jgi:hypothetical protein
MEYYMPVKKKKNPVQSCKRNSIGMRERREKGKEIKLSVK